MTFLKFIIIFTNIFDFAKSSLEYIEVRRISVISKKTFLDLAIKMIGFGIIIGISFPIFTTLLGVPKEISFSSLFFTACVLAGFLVGLTNYILTRLTVGKKLNSFIDKMIVANQHVITFENKATIDELDVNYYLINDESDDEFGQCAAAFNSLTESSLKALHLQKVHRDFIKRLSENLELESLSMYAIESLMQYTDATAGALFIEKDGELICTKCFGITSTETILENPILLDVLRTGKRGVYSFPENVKLDGVITTFTPSQLMLEPIIYNGIITGVILLATATELNFDFIEELDIFVSSLSLVLNNSLQHEQIQRLAALDPLTGIYNRRFGIKRLEEEVSRSNRSNLPMGVMLLDIDRFKNINDTYGHIAGDRFLKKMVAIIQPILRNGDVLLRYGGEEFLMILPGANKEDVYKIAERIRYAISECTVVYGEYEIKSTVSIGVDSLPESKIIDYMTLVANADRALYRAKGTGRNRTVIFEQS